MAEGIIYRYRCGMAWRDMPSEFGPWQPIWKRHRRYSGDGTWDRILAGYCRLLMPVEKWTGRFRLTPRLAAAYSSRAIRTHLRDHGITAVIPSQSTKIGHRKRRGSAGGRRPAFDKEDYKGRNVVERNFNTFKQCRALATRYDKLALTYRGGAVLRAVHIRLTALGDTPKLPCVCRRRGLPSAYGSSK